MHKVVHCRGPADAHKPPGNSHQCREGQGQDAHEPPEGACSGENGREGSPVTQRLAIQAVAKEPITAAPVRTKLNSRATCRFSRSPIIASSTHEFRPCQATMFAIAHPARISAITAQRPEKTAPAYAGLSKHGPATSSSVVTGNFVRRTATRTARVRAIPMKNIGRHPKAGSIGTAIRGATTPPSGIPAMVMVTTRDPRLAGALFRATVMAVVNAAPTPIPATKRPGHHDEAARGEPTQRGG